MVLKKARKNGPKLTGEKKKYRLEICKMLAMGYDASLVVQELKDQYGVEVSRANILKNYKHNPKRKRLIEILRYKMAAEIMKHPLANKRVRLSLIMRGINHALKWGVDKLYFDKDTGELLGKVEKVQLGALAALIREAREEVEGIKDPGAGFGLAELVKQVSEAHGRLRLDISAKRKVAPGEPAASDSMDKQGAGDIQILGRSSRHPQRDPAGH